MSDPPTLHTIGHGTRDLAELIGVLGGAGVEVLVDVRRHPGSSRNPQFGRDRLADALRRAGIRYEWFGEELGGRRRSRPGSRHVAWRNESFRAYADHMETREFAAALDRLVRLASDESTAVMCAETLWWRCHRRLVADAATARGLRVVHLGAGRPQLHRLDPSVRLDEDGTLVYDIGTTPPLVAEGD